MVKVHMKGGAKIHKRGGNQGRWVILAGLIACCWGISACFTIRPVEPPTNVNSDWVSPSDYEILLTNLRTAIAQQNVQNYLRCFQADELEFEPVASLFNENETVWQNWSIQDEQAYLDNVIANLSSGSGNALILEEEALQDVTEDSLKYVGLYTLRVNHTDTTLTTLFKGQLQLVIKLNSFNEWEIHRWQDIELYPDSSWSELKLFFGQ
ncbi:MAG: hypothetical protein AAFV07_04560 [Bacteroidota bacterium]